MSSDDPFIPHARTTKHQFEQSKERIIRKEWRKVKDKIFENTYDGHYKTTFDNTQFLFLTLRTIKKELDSKGYNTALGKNEVDATLILVVDWQNPK